MTTNAEIRAWARERGRDVPARGPLPDALLAEHDEWQSGQLAEQLAEAAAHVPGPRPPGDDDEHQGVSVSAGTSPPGSTAERRPRNVPAPGPRHKLAALTGRARDGKNAKAKAKGRQPRVPVDKLITSGWQLLANFARPLPATSRLLTLQAPVAGLILEDTVRGTVVDKLLQPVARVEAKGKATFALLGPPIVVTAMQLNPDTAPLLMPVLREGLLLWCEIAGPRMEEALKRESEFEAQHGVTVDKMIELLFAAPEGQAAAAADEQGKAA